MLPDLSVHRKTTNGPKLKSLTILYIRLFRNNTWFFSGVPSIVSQHMPIIPLRNTSTEWIFVTYTFNFISHLLLTLTQEAHVSVRFSSLFYFSVTSCVSYVSENSSFSSFWYPSGLVQFQEPQVCQIQWFRTSNNQYFLSLAV